VNIAKLPAATKDLLEMKTPDEYREVAEEVEMKG
jgi:hypothetical protein